MIRKQILLMDSTLRDGSHAMRHKFSSDHISRYAAGAEKAGIPLLVVGHGNGLGASSLLVGKSALTDLEMLESARKEVRSTKLGAFFIPGFATIRNDLDPVLSLLDFLVVAAHCSEADVTKQHIEFARGKGKDVYGVLMMQHMLDAASLLEQALKMESYGAQGIILMDSAGWSLPQDVREKVKALVGGLAVPAGFHAHNNLSMAVANSVEAVEAGALIIDGTSRGFGAGAGNCALESLVAILNRQGVPTGADLYTLLDNSETIVMSFAETMPTVTSTTLLSGLAGIFSGFCPLAEKAAVRFKVDVRDIIMELGKRRVVAGQEDFIVEIAMELAEKKAKDLACTF